jgi:hypothetical protein
MEQRKNTTIGDDPHHDDTHHDDTHHDDTHHDDTHHDDTHPDDTVGLRGRRRSRGSGARAPRPGAAREQVRRAPGGHVWRRRPDAHAAGDR